MMKSKSIIKFISVFLILSCLVIPSACDENNENEMSNSISEELHQIILKECAATNSTYEEVYQMLNKSKLTDPSLLNLLAEREDVLATSGTIPTTKTGIESYEWWLRMEKLAETMAQKNAFDDVINIELNGIGANADGHITIIVLAGQDKKSMDDDIEIIIQTVNKYAEMQNIKDVPIVIKEEEMPIGFVIEAEHKIIENRKIDQFIKWANIELKAQIRDAEEVFKMWGFGRFSE